ncbi:MAG TPA: DoxX family protein [Verrucomicrobiae bacterium]|nr:DoxX family protein [Verrucomicrobiae bacterium]
MTDTATTTDTQQHGTKSKMAIVTAIVRILLGLMFLFFGVVGLFNLMKPPAETPQDILAVLQALTNAGYMKVVAGAEVIIGALLLINRFVPLALALLAPIVVGIITFHVAMQPETIVPGLVVLVLQLYLVWAYRGAFRPMLRARVVPGP